MKRNPSVITLKMATKVNESSTKASGRSLRPVCPLRAGFRWSENSLSLQVRQTWGSVLNPPPCPRNETWYYMYQMGRQGWACSSGVEHLPSMHEALQNRIKDYDHCLSHRAVRIK